MNHAKQHNYFSAQIVERQNVTVTCGEQK